MLPYTVSIMHNDPYFLVVSKPKFCPTCGYLGHPPDARVTTAKVVGDSWVASGRLEFETECPCQSCGMSLTVIERAVPIQCEGFTCPVCRSDEHLSYEVTRIDNEKLKFTATINCTRCKKKRTLSKVFKRLLSMLTIKVGPLGISTKKSDEKDEEEE